LDSTPGDGQPAAELADAIQPALAPAGDTTEGQQADAGAEAAGTVAVIV